MSRLDNGTNKKQYYSQGSDYHEETTEFDAIGQHVKKGSVARVDRRLRRYYLIVRLLPNVFALACLSFSTIRGHLMMLEFPLRLHP